MLKKLIILLLNYEDYTEEVEQPYTLTKRVLTVIFCSVVLGIILYLTHLTRG